MSVFSIFIAEFIVLFFLSRIFVNSLFNLLLKITRSKFLTIYLTFIIFLPGILIHELSHYLFARALFVYAGNIKLMPELSEGNLKLGSVEVGKTDFVRRAIIGISPVISGTLIIVAVPFWFLFLDFSNTLSYVQIIIFLFIVFEVSNTMFSSRKDLKGAGKLAVFILLIVAYLYISKVSVLEYFRYVFLSDKISGFMQTSSVLLIIPLVVDLILIGLSRLLLSLETSR